MKQFNLESYCVGFIDMRDSFMYATEMASVGLAEEAFKQYLGLLSEI
jgi:hypothetical protein